MLSFLLPIVLSLCPGGSPGFAAGQKLQEKVNRRVDIRLTTSTELRALQRVSTATKPAPDHQAAIHQYLSERSPHPDLCLARLVGTIPDESREGQKCTFEVWSVECENGVQANVTLRDCSILQ